MKSSDRKGWELEANGEVGEKEIPNLEMKSFCRFKLSNFQGVNLSMERTANHLGWLHEVVAGNKYMVIYKSGVGMPNPWIYSIWSLK